MPLDHPGHITTAALPAAIADEARDEAQELLAAVDAFCRAEVATRRTRPEQALATADFAAIRAAAADSGLLDAGPDGYGLWSGDARLAFSLRALQRIAADDAAVAWQLHGGALASRLMVEFPADDGSADAACSFCCDASTGTGRSALGRWLAGDTAAPSDTDILADTFGTRARVSLLPPEATHMSALRWRDGSLQLETFALAPLTRHRDANPHGLDGCHAVTWALPEQSFRGRALSPPEAAGTLALHNLALLAIARGALQPAAQRAHDHARLRMQGARRILQHDAVAQLLCDMDSALLSVDVMLAGVTQMAAANAGTLTRLRHALAVRRDALPLLARAANAAMQVHGGSGYLRDTGLEHVWRSVNALRVMAGGEADSALLLAALGPASGGDAGPAATTAALPAAAAAIVALPAWANEPARAGQGKHSHLPGHLGDEHPLSPRRALHKARRAMPLLPWLAPREVLDPWERDTRLLPAPLAQLRRRVRRFAVAQCAPLADAIDREQRAGHAHSAALHGLHVQAARAGLLTDLLPAPLGSGPLRQFRHALALQQALRVEELARVDGGLMLFLSAHNLGLCPLLLSGDTGLLRRVVLPAFRRTEAGDPQVFAFAITEPAAGSDAEEGHGAAAQTPGVRARRAQNGNGTGWLLRGRKIFISGGDIARYVTVFAALGDEGYESWTCFLVDTRSAGFSVPRCELKCGMRASAAAEIVFDDCFVPDSMVVGGLRNGWALARSTLNLSRLPVAAMGVGFAQQAVDIATGFACRETLAGRPLVHYQQVQSTLAGLQAETGAIRQLVWHHARRWRVHADEAALCKFQATDRAQAVVEGAMDLLGNAGLQHAQRIERTLRDVRLTRIFEGTNQINRLAVIEEQQPLLLARIAGLAAT
jgi:alkylation response protein AidB-like acyl-CoA dehydrogenase